MHRYIPASPPTQVQHQLLARQQATLLRAMEKQNALLTDLLSAVNGLSALLCSRKE